MRTIITTSGQKVTEFIEKKVPSSLQSQCVNKLKVIKNNGEECIGAFVFPIKDCFFFRLESDTIPEKAEVYLLFDIHLVILIDVLVLV